MKGERGLLIKRLRDGRSFKNIIFMEHPTFVTNRVCQHFHLNRGMIIQRVVMRIEKFFIVIILELSAS